MRIRTSELPVAIDVDKTLILPVRMGDVDRMEFMYYGQLRIYRPHYTHIEFLKSLHARGYEITVWSANGYAWAKEVVTKLDLTPYVHEVATKPIIYVDDQLATEFMRRVYIEEE